MIPEAQRVAIAEACGYTAEKWESSGSWHLCKNGERCHHPLDSTGTKEWAFMQHAPDFLADLNACADMEKVLTTMYQKSLYLDFLYVIICSQVTEKWEREWFSVIATPPPRCEAFLRTLSLWKEDGQ